jgi:hypothetical protein
MRNYNVAIAKLKVLHSDKPSFSESQLDPKFIPFFESEQRIKVKMAYGEEFYGTVGMSQGWHPIWLLMHNCNSRGSSIILKSDTEILAVRMKSGKYRRLLFLGK